jgi:cyclopropane-fatty-acyl-phospholipid synthase
MESVSYQSTSDGSGVQTSRFPTTDGSSATAPSTMRPRLSHQSSRPWRLEKTLLRRLLVAMGSPPLVIVLWNGEEISAAANPAPGATRARVHDRGTLWRVLFDPFFQFPDAYTNGHVDIDGDLEGLMCRLAHCSADVPASTRRFAFVENILHRGSRSTLAASRENIHHHYDLGNDFYRLWLDENLLYTCAYFEEPTASLEQAQSAKMDHVCRKLMLQPGESVIEAGCGWGGFALHMAKNYGVRVRAYNISKEQVAEARRRARAEGLDDRVEFILDDWRNITGSCDVFVSIGMLEHVGIRNYRRLGTVINRCLTAGGRGLMHTIGRNRRQPLDAWIEQRIFPGARPPSLGQMGDIFEEHEFSVLEVENLRLHYAETLRHWLARYEQSVDRVAQMYDARFVRMWRVYLAGSIAAFESGSLQLFQALFARPRQNRLPLTRAHLYSHLGGSEGNGEAARPTSWGDR